MPNEYDPCINGTFVCQGKKLPSNIDEDNEEGDVTDEDSADEMEDDCKLINGAVRTLLLFLSLSLRPFYSIAVSILFYCILCWMFDANWSLETIFV